MKLDERFMTILTALLVLVGVGAVLNRGEDGTSVFSSGGGFTPKADNFTLRAGRLQSLDVLLNDSNSDRIDPTLLQVVEQPACGLAQAVGGAIQYSDSANCSGRVVFSYCVPDGDNCMRTDVTLNVLEVDQGGNAVAARQDGSPVVVDVIQQGSAPQQAPQIAMKQPMRLTLPSNAEVITPAQAAEEIRRLGSDSGQTVLAANQSDSAVVVSNTSARTGSVSTAGISMSAPSPDGETLELALSAPSSPSPSPARSAAPGGLVVTSVESPSFGQSPSISLEVPQPIEAPLPGANTETATAVETPVVEEPPVVAETPAVAEPDAPAQETEIAALPVEETDVPAPAAIEPETEIALADGPAPEAQSALTHAPNRGRVDIPENSGVLASIARSNSVFGATFSAAKALLAPSTGRDTVALAPAGDSAPRPRDFDIIASLDGNIIIQDAVALQPISGADRPIQARGVETIRVAALSTETGFVPRTFPAAPPKRIEIATPEVTEEPAPETTETEIAALPPQDGALDGDTGRLPVVSPAPRPEVNCEIDMVLTVRVGAEILATLSSPCRPETPFIVDHAGLQFTAFTDIDGVADFLVPAMASNATVSVRFADGGATVSRADVENMSRMTRVAVVWEGDIDFDLHAYEFGAAAGGNGHVSVASARDYRTARRAGGGYLMSFGPNAGPGMRAEVYTIFESSRTEEGLIDLQLEVAGVGDGCTGAPALYTVRSEGASLAGQAVIDAGITSCDLSNAELSLINAVGDIDMAAR